MAQKCTETVVELVQMEINQIAIISEEEENPRDCQRI